MNVLPTVERQRQQLQRLKHELSRLDVRISRLRIGVRQAELDTRSVLPLQLDGCHALIEQLVSLRSLANKIANSKKELPRLVTDPTLLESLNKDLMELGNLPHSCSDLFG